MDLVTQTQQALSPQTTPTLLRTTSLHSSNSSEPSFPIIAIAIIGIIATAFLLVSYYIFVIKCCLSWHRIDILRRFSLSRSARSHDELLMAHSPASGGPDTRGLDESTIRSIPILLFKKDAKLAPENNDNNHHNTKINSECAVCLSEFEEFEKLRMIPNCCHVFHIDCIDVWLQNNANCPLCRTSVSLPSAAAAIAGNGLARFVPTDRIVAPSSSPIEPSPHARSLAGGDEDYVVIELEPADSRRDERVRAATRSDSFGFGSAKRVRKFQKGTSMGDECIDMGRDKDEQFSVQPIRRSFSMDSSADRNVFVAIQEALRQHSSNVDANNSNVVSPIGGNIIEGSCSGNRSVRRSFFSFGHGSRGSSRSAVLPVYLEP